MVKKKIDAPMPRVIGQEFEDTNEGRKAITTIAVGPHIIEIYSYPNRGYYISVNGVSDRIGIVQALIANAH